MSGLGYWRRVRKTGPAPDPEFPPIASDTRNPDMAPVTRILVIDDHPVVAFGLRVLFAEDPRRAVVGHAADAASALKAAVSDEPDVIILDLVLGGRDGIELMRGLLSVRPSARVIVYSSQDERLFAIRVLQAGGSGYVAKSEDLASVARAVEAVVDGRLFFSMAVSEQILHHAARHPVAAISYSDLSNRELQVFRLIGEGRSSQEIAAELNLSVKTIGTYRERLKLKLCLGNARDLERAAFGHAMSSSRG